jgi:mycofactocin precursor
MSQLSNDPSEPTPEVLEAEPAEGELIEADLLVEDVSIDGMCGVY